MHARNPWSVGLLEQTASNLNGVHTNNPGTYPTHRAALPEGSTNDEHVQGSKLMGTPWKLQQCVMQRKDKETDKDE
eukprot:11224608-Lingulodinium_polyedra.AAC.1